MEKNCQNENGIDRYTLLSGLQYLGLFAGEANPYSYTIPGNIMPMSKVARANK